MNGDMRLRDLLTDVVRKEIAGSDEVEITDIVEDSRRVTAGALFVALRGQHEDGHRFAADAAAAGAAALLVEEPCPVGIPQVVVPSTRRVAPLLAHRLYGWPASGMTMVAVTGTNGKTTTSTLIEQILQHHGQTTGLIGTIEQRTSKGRLRASEKTTPMAWDLARTLKEMRDLSVRFVVMEAASIALVQARTAGIRFRVAAFTNLTQDHLDDHGSMEAYGAAKGLLFSRLGNDFSPCADGGLPVAVLNADDTWSARYSQDTVQQVVTYGIDRQADVRASDVDVRAEGVRFHLASFAGEADVLMRMTGRFSVYNALCATASCLVLGVPLQEILDVLQSIGGVPGRLERVDAGQSFTILVDYSHTPDSLKNALATIREFARGRVITVVGCGGDRDRTKRPKMAQIAASFSDLTVLTSDNPRTEDPEAIIDEMAVGLAGDAHALYERFVDREAAIRRALAAALPDDVVLIAGKGHETYQIIGHTQREFDDREVAARIVREGR